MKTWVVLISCLLVGCASFSRNAAVSPTKATLTFDAIAFNQKRIPDGWRAAISITVRDGRVYAETSQDNQAFALLSHSTDEVTCAVVELHEWAVRREIASKEVAPYIWNRIQYGYISGGAGVGGLVTYRQIAELPESIQHLYRAALDQVLLHVLSREEDPNMPSGGDVQ